MGLVGMQMDTSIYLIVGAQELIVILISEASSNVTVQQACQPTPKPSNVMSKTHIESDLVCTFFQRKRLRKVPPSFPPPETAHGQSHGLRLL